MSDPGGGHEEARLQAAANWFARMRADDAENSRADFETWRADPLNQAAYEAIAGTWSSTEMGHWAPVVQDYRRSSAPTSQPKRQLWSMGRLALAASFLVLVVSAVFWRQAVGGDTAAVEVASALGEIRIEKLPDGSTIILDTDTRATFAFSDHERRVQLLHGRARFDVAHDASRPFVVEAEGRSVTARGTMFDVEISRRGLIVKLLRGSIDVAPLAVAQKSAFVRLIPGQTLLASSAAATPAIVADADVPQWPEGRMSYRSATLAKILDDAARYSTRRIKLADASMADIKVTGVFSVRDPDKLADRLAAALGLKSTHSPEGIVLVR